MQAHAWVQVRLAVCKQDSVRHICMVYTFSKRNCLILRLYSPVTGKHNWLHAGIFTSNVHVNSQMLRRVHTVFYSLHAQKFELLWACVWVQVRLAVCKQDSVQHICVVYAFSKRNCLILLLYSPVTCKHNWLHPALPASSCTTPQQVKTPMETLLVGSTVN